MKTDKQPEHKGDKQTIDALFDEVEATAGQGQADALREAVSSSPFLATLLYQGAKEMLLNM